MKNLTVELPPELVELLGSEEQARRDAKIAVAPAAFEDPETATSEDDATGPAHDEVKAAAPRDDDTTLLPGGPAAEPATSVLSAPSGSSGASPLPAPLDRAIDRLEQVTR